MEKRNGGKIMWVFLRKECCKSLTVFGGVMGPFLSEIGAKTKQLLAELCTLLKQEGC